MEQGFAWTDQLALLHGDLNRAALRGRRKQRQSQEFPLEAAIRRLPGSRAPWSEGGPLWPLRTSALACAWTTREVELAASDLGDSHVHVSERFAEWTLSASKTDAQAKATIVRLGCTAPESTQRCALTEWPPCPCCQLWEQREAVRAVYEGVGLTEELIRFRPFFP